MSEIEEDSGMSESSSEIETEASSTHQPESVGEPALTELAPGVSNQEAMVAQTLSRVKKQSKQLDKVNKMLGQQLGHLKDLDKKQSRQVKQIEQQVRQLQSQVKQLHKQVARTKTSGSKIKKKVTKKRKR
jgi:archaellum component FlaC